MYLRFADGYYVKDGRPTKEPAAIRGALRPLRQMYGLTIAADVLFLQPFTGASMNPARTFGPALAARHWINHGVYWIGPLFGGIIAAVVYDRLFTEDKAAA